MTRKFAPNEVKAKDRIEEEETKITIRVNNKAHTNVANALFHGQMALLFRNIFKSLSLKITSGKIKDITSYIYGERSLTLDKVTPTKANEKE